MSAVPADNPPSSSRRDGSVAPGPNSSSRSFKPSTTNSRLPYQARADGDPATWTRRHRPVATSSETSTVRPGSSRSMPSASARAARFPAAAATKIPFSTVGSATGAEVLPARTSSERRNHVPSTDRATTRRCFPVPARTVTAVAGIVEGSVAGIDALRTTTPPGAPPSASVSPATGRRTTPDDASGRWLLFDTWRWATTRPFGSLTVETHVPPACSKP